LRTKGRQVGEGSLTVRPRGCKPLVCRS
jgi:hypothetical protein